MQVNSNNTNNKYESKEENSSISDSNTILNESVK